MKIAVFAGSFDPMTLGHLNLIERLLAQFSQVHVLIARSEAKNYLFAPEERKNIVSEVIKNERLRVIVHEGLTVDYLRTLDQAVLVRGLRAASDFDYEMTMASMNKMLHPQIETLVLFSAPQFAFLSSRFVKEIAKNGGDISQMVPPLVVQKMQGRL